MLSFSYFPAGFISRKVFFFTKLTLIYFRKCLFSFFFALINFREWSYFKKFAHINFREFFKFAKVYVRESFCARKFLYLRYCNVNTISPFFFKEAFASLYGKPLGTISKISRKIKRK